ncbi:hypothetical protein FQN57_001153 [Myotisia sp. PD_48]|nr:hypothetical protein FQN57_001153 [Myotisia sp. PD_48]
MSINTLDSVGASFQPQSDCNLRKPLASYDHLPISGYKRTDLIQLYRPTDMVPSFCDSMYGTLRDIARLVPLGSGEWYSNEVGHTYNGREYR